LLLLPIAVAASNGKGKLEAAGADDESAYTTGVKPGALENAFAVLDAEAPLPH
jgi:hypothetical protein